MWHRRVFLPNKTGVVQAIRIYARIIPPMSILSISGLTVHRGTRCLFADLGFQLARGQGLHVRGANGVGKTTLLKMLAGLVPPRSGQIIWQDKTPAQWGDEYHAQIHYFGHRDALKELFTPLDNLMLSAALAGQACSEKAAMAVLARVGLARQALLPVRGLSQGQKKRAALARLLAVQRPVWLLDEPFVGLDDAAQADLGLWISEHLAAGGLAIFTSHQTLPAALADSAVLNLGGVA